MPQPILIEFVADLTAIEKGIDQLEKLGLVDKKAAEEFKKASAVYAEHNKKLTESGQKVEAVKVELQEMVDAIKKVPKKIIEDAATKSVDAAGNAIGGVTTKATRMTRELRSIREEMQRLEMQGKANTKEFRDMAMRAGELTDQIGDTQARVKILASDTKHLDAALSVATGLAGGFAAAQGAAALFGDENEDLMKSMMKVQAAMSLVTGIQAVANMLNKDSAASVMANVYAEKLRAFFIDQTTKQLILQRVVTASLVTGGLAAMAVGIYLLIKNTREWSDKMNRAAINIKGLQVSTEEYNEIMSAGAVSTAETTATLKAYLDVAKDVNASDDQRNNALDYLNENYGEYLGNLTKDNVASAEKNALVENYIKLRAQQAVVDAYASVITEREKKFIEAKNEAMIENEKSMIRANRIADEQVAKDVQGRYQEEITKKTENHRKVMSALQEQMTEEVAILTSLTAGFKSVTDQGDQYDETMAGIELKMKAAEGDLLTQIGLQLQLLDVKEQQINADEKLGTNQKELRKQELDAIRDYLAERKRTIEEGTAEPIEILPMPDELQETIIEPSIEVVKNYVDKVRELMAAMRESAGEDRDADIREMQEMYDQAAEMAYRSFNAILSAARAAKENELTELDEKLAKKQISEEEYEKKSAEIKTKMAKQEKAMNVFKGVLAIPASFLQGLSEGGLPMAIFYAALATIEAASIAATKIPKFAKGTERVTGGEPGKDSVLSWLMPDERVTPADINKEYFPILSAIHHRSIPAAFLNQMAKAPNFGAMLQGTDVAVLQGPEIDYDRLGSVFGKEISRLPITNHIWDAEGYHKSVINGTKRINYLEHRYSSK